MSVYESFDEQKQFACRVIADHARATAFAIADGILPGNEGRNYVLRKIMRRAIYHGREHLGFDGLFFHKVCGKVIDEMNGAYPELELQRDFIDKMVRLEEERFGTTMSVGLKKLNELMNASRTIHLNYPEENCFPGGISASKLAQLYDTFGTPIDLMYVVLATHSRDINSKYVKSNYSSGKQIYSWEVLTSDRGIFPISSISEDDFKLIIDNELKNLQSTSEIGKTKQAEKINPIYTTLERTSVRSKFRGYTENVVEGAKVLALVKDDLQVNELSEGDEGLIVLDETPFYAEAGGQVGDTGTIKGANVAVKVFDTFAPIKDITLHKSKVERGSLKVGDVVTAQIDVERRDEIRRNHTGTHLVHSALREVLGTHVKQAGSVVAPNYLRFDFTHYQPISAEEIAEIERLVTREILKNSAMETKVMSYDEARQTGAMALFGEKYGSEVRVVYVGDGEFSKELCGGTHVRSTGDIGVFKITADEAVASGVRRIRAITGFDAFARFREDEEIIEKSLGALKTQRDNLPNAIEKLQEELKKARRENEDLKMKIATGAVGNANEVDETKEVGGVKIIAKKVEGLDASGMRNLSDTLLGKLKSGVVALGKSDEGKVSIIVRVSSDLTDKIKAGNIIKEIAPIVGGRGGGKPDMAEGGGNLPEKLDEALNAVVQQITNGMV